MPSFFTPRAIWRLSVTAGLLAITACLGDQEASPSATSRYALETCPSSAPCRLWSSSDAPSATASTTGGEYGIQIQSSENGYIAGISFFKEDGLANHTVNLWDASGDLLATANDMGVTESAGGWQSVTFAAPVAVSADTTYVASYFTSGSVVAQDAAFFQSSLTTGPLTALANDDGVGNGVYVEGSSSAFPSTSAGANYWVDVLFTTQLDTCTLSAPCTIFPADDTPGSIIDWGGVEVGLQWETSEAGYVSAIRFYKADGASTHTVSLWEPRTGDLIATATDTPANETMGDGWQSVAFSPPVPVSAATPYLASYLSLTGVVGFDASYFAGNDVTNGPLMALNYATSVNVGNGVFIPASTPTFPIYPAYANFWVDVAFTTQAVLPPLPASWTETQWYVDPMNTAGTATDNNACTRPTEPCLTFGGIVQHWGTASPRLGQDTTISFSSSQPDGTNPVDFTPYLENGSTVTLRGTLGSLQQVASGQLSVAAGRDQATGQLLEVGLPAGAAPGQLVVDTMQGSRAWVYRADGGNWLVSQPIAADALTTPFPSEDTGWAGGDSIVLYQPIALNISQVVPVLADGVGTGRFGVVIQDLAIVDPSVGTDAGVETVSIGSGVYFTESAILKGVSLVGGGQGYASGFSNTDINGPIDDTAPGSTLTFWGGQSRFGGMTAYGAVLDGDFTLGAASNAGSGLYAPTFGSVFLDQGVVCGLWSNNEPSVGGRPMVLWGGGTLDVLGTSQLQYPAGASASQTFLLAGGLYLDGDYAGLLQSSNTAGTTACSVDTSGAGGWTCGIPLTAANLDRSVQDGGFGGSAVNPGGGSITRGDSN